MHDTQRCHLCQPQAQTTDPNNAVASTSSGAAVPYAHHRSDGTVHAIGDVRGMASVLNDANHNRCTLA
ncbi:hypothetical protein GCM10027287_18780 [Bordetella muralis]|jgi:hypothetical protein